MYFVVPGVIKAGRNDGLYNSGWEDDAVLILG